MPTAVTCEFIVVFTYVFVTRKRLKQKNIASVYKQSATESLSI